MSIEKTIEILQALLTPVIALTTTYIAWQQWRTNRQKLNLEKYDRRLHVYSEVMKIFQITIRDARASPDDLLRFRTSVSEADFLFGSEIPKYIDEIYKRGINLWHWSRKYKDLTQETPDGYDHQRVVDEMHKELEWFSEQFEPAKKKFKKYLNIS